MIVYPDRRGSTPAAGSKLGPVVDLDVSATQGTSVPAAAVPTVLLEDTIFVHIVDPDLVSGQRMSEKVCPTKATYMWLAPQTDCCKGSVWPCFE